MSKSPLFALFAALVVPFAAVALLAQYFSLFWIYPWLDIPMHIFGGLVIAFGFWSWRERRGRRHPSLRETIWAVVAIGVAWELFQAFVGTPTESVWFGDTIFDVAMDVVGGIVGHYAARRIATLL